MSKVAFFHGTNDGPEKNWYPWLINELEKVGSDVYAPLLPNNHTPNKEIYDIFLKESGWDFRDNVLIGHSSGATTVLNLLSSDWFPEVRAAILVSTFLNEKLLAGADWVEPGQFDNLFLPLYDTGQLTKKCQKFYFIHSEDDPYCDIDDAKQLAHKVNGKLITIKHGHHLGSTWGNTEFPEIIDIMTKNKLL